MKLFLGITVVSLTVLFVAYTYLPQYREDGTVAHYSNGPSGHEWIYPGSFFVAGVFLIVWALMPDSLKQRMGLIKKKFCRFMRKKTGLMLND